MSAFTGYIYSITNILNGHRYIGKTNDIKRRWNEHRYGHGNTAILNKAFKKYGINSFLFDIVAEIPFNSVEELNDVLTQLEVYYIDLYNTFNDGYNATVGGEGISGYKQTRETTEKIRQANLGKVRSKETRKRISTSRKGIGHTQKTKEKITKALLQRDHTIYEKMADKLRGRTRDPEMIMRAAEKRRKPILQYDMKGNFIKEYGGASQAGFGRGANISACCRGKIISAEGYVWRFKESDNYPKKIYVPKIRSSRKRPIIQYNISRDIIAEYPSISSAARAMGVSSSNFHKYLHKNKSIKGYIFKYKEEKEVAYAKK